jgi:hypothetical protein
MFGAITNLVSYARKPRAALFLRHPVKAIRIARFRHDLKEAVTPRRLAIGIGAAAVAVPFGIWLGRRVTAA